MPFGMALNLPTKATGFFFMFLMVVVFLVLLFFLEGRLVLVWRGRLDILCSCGSCGWYGEEGLIFGPLMVMWIIRLSARPVPTEPMRIFYDDLYRTSC